MRPEQQIPETALDPLMGIPMRKQGWQWLEIMGKRAEREGWPLSVVMLDLDDFKTINDRFGHEEGDRILQAWGAFIRRNLPPETMAFRYGGDEVLLVCPGHAQADVVTWIERWIDLIRREGLGGYRLGVSAGVATYPEDTVHWIELVSLADAALLEGKSRGKFCVSTVNFPEPEFRWPPSFVPRPVESRALEEAFSSHPIVVVRGDPGTGKSRLIQEVIVRKFPSVLQNAFRPDARGVWLSREHLRDPAFLSTVAQALQEGQKVILEVWPRDESRLVQSGLHEAWKRGWVKEISIPPMGREQVHLLVRRTLGGWVSRRFVDEVFRYTAGRPAYVGALLNSLVAQGWLTPRGRSYRTLGIPPGLCPEGLEPYWTAQISSLSGEARKGLGILGMAGGPLPLPIWEATLEIFGLRDQSLEILEEIRDLVIEKNRELSLRDPALSGFARALVGREERARVARIFLRALPDVEDVTRLMWLHEVDPKRARETSRKWLEEAIATLDVPRVRRVLRWVLHNPRWARLPWVQMSQGWLAFVQGAPREARDILSRFSMDELAPPFRRMRVVAHMDTGNLEEARNDLAWWEAHARGQERDEARVYRAMWLTVSRRFPEAEKILKHLEKTPDLSPLSRADVVLGLGQIAMFAGHHPRALRYYRKALDIVRRYDYPRGEMVNLTALAYLYHHRGNLARTEEVVQEAIERARDAETADVEAFILERMGALYLDQGYLHQSAVRFKEALEICAASGVVRLLPYLYQDLTRWALYRGDQSLAESHLSRAISLARIHIHDPDHAWLERIWLDLEKRPVLSFPEFLSRENEIVGVTLEIVLGAGRLEDWVEVYPLLQERPILDLRARFIRDVLGSVHDASQGYGEKAREKLRRAYRRLRLHRSPMAYGWYLWARALVWGLEGNLRWARRLGTKARQVMDNLGLDYWVHKIDTTCAPWFGTSC